MTRETKIGLVVAASFLCLVGGVLGVKYLLSRLGEPGDTGAPAVATRPPEKQPGDEAQSAPEEAPLYKVAANPDLPPPPPAPLEVPGFAPLPLPKRSGAGLEVTGTPLKPSVAKSNKPDEDDEFIPTLQPRSPVKRAVHEVPAAPTLPAPGGPVLPPPAKKDDKAPPLPVPDLPKPDASKAGPTPPPPPMPLDLPGFSPATKDDKTGNNGKENKPMGGSQPLVELPPPGAATSKTPPEVVPGLPVPGDRTGEPKLPAPAPEKLPKPAPMGGSIKSDLEPPPIGSIKLPTDPKPTLPAGPMKPLEPMKSPARDPKPLVMDPALPADPMKPLEPMKSPARDPKPLDMDPMKLRVGPGAPTLPGDNLPAAPKIGDPGPAAALGPRPGVADLPEARVDSYDEEWYYCKQGDTLEAISQKFFFTPKYEQSLRQYNLDRNYSTVFRPERPSFPQGQVVKVPPARVLEKMYPTVVPGFRGTGNPGPAGVPASVPATDASPGSEDIGAAREYTVRREGMTLRDIAKEELRDANQWTRIFMLNREWNPSAPVPVGTRIYLPRGQ